MQSLSRFLNLRRMGAAFAACLGIAAWLIPVPSATAATVNLTGGTTASCTYSNVSGTASGDFTFTCTGGGPSPGVLALSLGSTAPSLAPNGTTTLAVTRTGVTAGGGIATGNLAVTGDGGCTLNPSSVTFPDGSGTADPPGATVTVRAGPNPGMSCTVTLTAGGASLGSPPFTTINIVDPNANVSFQFSAATSTANFGATTPLQITVTRTGGTAGTYEVPFYVGGSLVDNTTGFLVAGGGTLAPPVAVVPPTTAYAYAKLTFPAGSGASQTISYTPPAALPAGVTPPATIGFQLTAPLLLGEQPPNQVPSLGATSLHVTTVETLAGCATSATHVVPWNGSQTIVSQVKPGETGAVTINPTPALIGTDGYMQVVVSETSSTGDKADIHYTLSACPGDFTPAIIPASNCAQHSQYTGGTMRFSIGPKPAGTPWYLYVCELPVGTTTVYFNFRQIKKPTPVPPSAPGTASCQFTTCPIYVQFN